MGKRDKAGGPFELSRRDFLKVAGAGTAAVAAGDLAFRPSRADAAAVAATYHTTCPYCSASCGQMVDVDASGNVLDIYGDYNSPINNGGLCAKGAGGFQLATNARRVGAWAAAHPVKAAFTYDAAYEATGKDGVAYYRAQNGTWSKMDLTTALDEIATKLIAARAVDTDGWSTANSRYSSKSVAFFGSSHMNNEQNYLYRKIIANFGTQNTEHQARI